MGCWDSFDKSTPKCTINNMTMKEIKIAVAAESKWIKLAKLLSAIIVAITSVVTLSYFIVRHNNVNALQENCTDLVSESYVVYCSNSTMYDFNF